VIALATAGATFAVGMIVLPIEKPAPEPPPPAALSPPPAPAAPPPAPVPAPATDAAALTDASASTPGDAKAAPAPTDATAEPAAKADAAAAPEAASGGAKAEAPASREKTAEKDVAREAWRKNQPDISVDGGKATMIIPIKGSIDGATYHVTTKPRSVLVTLPKGESMITMPYYPLKRDGFRQLWIKKDEQSGATVLRIVLGDGSEPQADIKDDYVRVTVRRPAEAPDEGGKPEGAKTEGAKSDKSDKSESAKPTPESP
jgi:hypothetical protein